MLSYPCVESYIASSFMEKSFMEEVATGLELSRFLEDRKINQSRITGQTVLHAVHEMERALAYLGIRNYDVDQFASAHLEVFRCQESRYGEIQAYSLLSLLSIMLIDLGLITFEK